MRAMRPAEKLQRVPVACTKEPQRNYNRNGNRQKADEANGQDS